MCIFKLTEGRKTILKLETDIDNTEMKSLEWQHLLLRLTILIDQHIYTLLLNNNAYITIQIPRCKTNNRFQNIIVGLKNKSRIFKVSFTKNLCRLRI